MATAWTTPAAVWERAGKKVAAWLSGYIAGAEFEPVRHVTEILEDGRYTEKSCRVLAERARRAMFEYAPVRPNPVAISSTTSSRS